MFSPDSFVNYAIYSNPLSPCASALMIEVLLQTPDANSDDLLPNFRHFTTFCENTGYKNIDPIQTDLHVLSFL